MAGRPTKFNVKLGRDICTKMLVNSPKKSSLRYICSLKSMPDRKSVYTWLLKAQEEGASLELQAFLHQYEMSVLLRSENCFDEILHVVYTETDTSRARSIVDALKWCVSKMLPDKYGDRQATDLTIKSNGAACDAIQKITESFSKGGSSDTSRKKSS